MRTIIYNDAVQIKKEIYEATKVIAEKYDLNVWMPAGSMGDQDMKFSTILQVKK